MKHGNHNNTKIITCSMIFFHFLKKTTSERNYEYEEYWSRQGKKMKQSWKTNETYELQEKTIVETIRKLKFQSVLELGCGFGRITKKILHERPDIKRYLAVDLSKHQLEHVKKDFPSVETKCALIQDLKSLDKFDLVIAVDFLMHIKPQDIEKVMKIMYDSHNNHMVNLDYFPIPKYAFPKLAPHNFLHNYPLLYEKLDLKPFKNQFSDLQAIFYTNREK